MASLAVAQKILTAAHREARYGTRLALKAMQEASASDARDALRVEVGAYHMATGLARCIAHSARECDRDRHAAMDVLIRAELLWARGELG